MQLVQTMQYSQTTQMSIIPDQHALSQWPLQQLQELYIHTLQPLGSLSDQLRVRNALRSRMAGLAFDMWVRETDTRIFGQWSLEQLQQQYVRLRSMGASRAEQSIVRTVLARRMSPAMYRTWLRNTFPQQSQRDDNSSRSLQRNAVAPSTQNANVYSSVDQMQLVVHEQLTLLNIIITDTQESLGQIFSSASYQRAVDPIAAYEAGRNMRTGIIDNMRSHAHVCAVCNRERTRTEMYSDAPVAWTSISHTELLRCDGPRNKQCPRDALTRATIAGVDFCVQPDFVHVAEDGTMAMDACTECVNALNANTIPPASLVRVDTGTIPSHLPPLSLLESYIIAPSRPYRLLYLSRPHSQRVRCDRIGEHCDDADTAIVDMRSHVIAYKNTAAADIAQLLTPLPLSALAERISVCILAPGTTEEEARTYVTHTSALVINGPAIITWGQPL